MRDVRRVLWLLCGLFLASPLSAQEYLRVGPGTWVVGGVADLADSERFLTLVPERCNQQVALVEMGVGFVIDGELTTLDVAGIVKGPHVFEIEVLFRNLKTGKCDPSGLVEVEGAASSFLLQDLPMDSKLYWDSRTSEVELCLQIRSSCGPPATEDDAVAVQDLTIGPKGGGM